MAILANRPLPDGCSPVPAGKIASVVSYLEMKERPPIREVPIIDPLPPPLHWRAPSCTSLRSE
jgi:hypothetical protein